LGLEKESCGLMCLKILRLTMRRGSTGRWPGSSWSHCKPAGARSSSLGSTTREFGESATSTAFL
jgi:hypothetical protein